MSNSNIQTAPLLVDLKPLAKSICHQLDNKQIEIKHLTMLNILAKAHGFKNYQHYNAALQERKAEKPIRHPIHGDEAYCSNKPFSVLKTCPECGETLFFDYKLEEEVCRGCDYKTPAVSREYVSRACRAIGSHLVARGINYFRLQGHEIHVFEGMRPDGLAPLLIALLAKLLNKRESKGLIPIFDTYGLVRYRVVWDRDIEGTESNLDVAIAHTKGLIDKGLHENAWLRFEDAFLFDPLLEATSDTKMATLDT